MERYRELFLAEAREHLGAAFEIQLALETHPGEPASWKELMRHAHSIKGMAATMGYDSLVLLAHALEDFLERGEVLQAEGPPLRLPLLADSLACMARIVDRVERGTPTASTRAEELARELSAITSEPQSSATATERAPLSPVAEEPVNAASRGGTAQAEPTGEEGVDWRVDLLLEDHPARSAELTVAVLRELANLGRVAQVDPPRLDLQRGRFEGRLGLVLCSTLERTEIEPALRRLSGVQGCSLSRAHLQPPPPKPTSSQRWVRVRAERLDALVAELQELRVEQARLRPALPPERRELRDRLERAGIRLDAIYGDVLDLRLVPFDSVAQRLHQVVRSLARQIGKQVRFEIVGGTVRLDRSVLDGLIDPLLHMLRNALDHGIERTEERRATGKPERGFLGLELERRGERVHFRLVDDGRGICPDALRRAALREGRITEREAADLTPDELLMLSTCPGLSTAETVSHFSGRGVGLDVVRQTVERLGGNVSIGSEPGNGTRIDLEVPLRVALIQTLLVRAAGELYALPMDAGLHTLRRDREATADLARLPAAGHAEPGDGSWVVEIGAGEQRSGLLVDEVLGRRELLVNPLPPPLGLQQPYAGAAVLENGEIVLVLDPQQLRPG